MAQLPACRKRAAADTGPKGELILKSLTRAVDRLVILTVRNRGSSTVHRPYTRDYSHISDPRFLQQPEAFFFKPEPAREVEVIKVERFKGLKAAHLRFPSPIRTQFPENNLVYAYHMRIDSASRLPTLIVLHGWGSKSFWFEKWKVCARLARAGIESLLLSLPYHHKRTPEGSWSGEYMVSGDVVRTAEACRQAVVEVRAILPWLRQLSPQVGILGISLGGIIAHMAMAVESFDVGVTMLACGNSAGMVWEGLMTRCVKRDIERAGITREDLERIWAVVNPTNLARHNKVKNLLMINSKFDEIIKPEFTIELWEALGRPQIRWYPCAHYSSFFFFDRMMDDVIRFVKRLV